MFVDEPEHEESFMNICFFFSLLGLGVVVRCGGGGILSRQDVLVLRSKQENTTCGTHLCT